MKECSHTVAVLLHVEIKLIRMNSMPLAIHRISSGLARARQDKLVSWKKYVAEHRSYTVVVFRSSRKGALRRETPERSVLSDAVVMVLERTTCA